MEGGIKPRRFTVLVLSELGGVDSWDGRGLFAWVGLVDFTGSSGVEAFAARAGAYVCVGRKDGAARFSLLSSVVFLGVI